MSEHESYKYEYSEISKKYMLSVIKQGTFIYIHTHFIYHRHISSHKLPVITNSPPPSSNDDKIKKNCWSFLQINMNGSQDNT